MKIDWIDPNCVTFTQYELIDAIPWPKLVVEASVGKKFDEHQVKNLPFCAEIPALIQQQQQQRPRPGIRVTVPEVVIIPALADPHQAQQRENGASARTRQ